MFDKLKQFQDQDLNFVIFQTYTLLAGAKMSLLQGGKKADQPAKD
jgi:hypothetical protein